MKTMSRGSSSPELQIHNLKKKLIVLSILRQDQELSNDSLIYLNSKLLETKLLLDLSEKQQLQQIKPFILKSRRANVNSSQALSESFKLLWEAGLAADSSKDANGFARRDDVVKFFEVMYCAMMSCSREDLVFNIEEEVSYYEKVLGGGPFSIYTFTDALIDFFELWSELIVPSHRSKFISVFMALIVKFPQELLHNYDFSQITSSANGSLTTTSVSLHSLEDIVGKYKIFNVTNFNSIMQCLEFNGSFTDIFEFTTYSLDKCVKFNKNFSLYYKLNKKLDSSAVAVGVNSSISKNNNSSNSCNSSNNSNGDGMSSVGSDLMSRNNSANHLSISNYNYIPLFDLMNANDEEITLNGDDKSEVSVATSIIAESCSSWGGLFDSAVKSVQELPYPVFKSISPSFAAYAISRDKSILQTMKSQSSREFVTYSIYNGPNSPQNNDDDNFNVISKSRSSSSMANSLNKGEHQKKALLLAVERKSITCGSTEGNPIPTPLLRITKPILSKKEYIDFKATSFCAAGGGDEGGSLVKLSDDQMSDDLILEGEPTDSQEEAQSKSQLLQLLHSPPREREYPKIELFKTQEPVLINSLLFDQDFLNRTKVEDILFKSKNILTKDVVATDCFRPNIKIPLLNDKFESTTPSNIYQVYGMNKKYLPSSSSSSSFTSTSNTARANSPVAQRKRIENMSDELGDNMQQQQLVGSPDQFTAPFDASRRSFNDSFPERDFLLDEVQFDNETFSVGTELTRDSINSSSRNHLAAQYMDGIGVEEQNLVNNEDSLLNDNVLYSEEITRLDTASISSIVDHVGQELSKPFRQIDFSDEDILSENTQSREITPFVPQLRAGSHQPQKNMKEHNGLWNTAIVGTHLSDKSYDHNGSSNNPISANNEALQPNTTQQQQYNRSLQGDRSGHERDNLPRKNQTRKNNFKFNNKLRPISPLGKAVKEFKSKTLNVFKDDVQQYDEKGLIYDCISLPSKPQFWCSKKSLVMKSKSDRIVSRTGLGEAAFSAFDADDQHSVNSNLSGSSFKTNDTHSLMITQSKSAIFQPLQPFLSSNNLLAASYSAATLKMSHPLYNSSVDREGRPAPWVPQGALDDRCHDRSNLKFAWEQRKDYEKLVPVDPSKYRNFTKKQDALKEVFEGYVKNRVIKSGGGFAYFS